VKKIQFDYRGLLCQYRSYKTADESTVKITEKEGKIRPSHDNGISTERET